MLVCVKGFTQTSSSYSNIVAKYHVSFLVEPSNESSRRDEIMTLLIGDDISLYRNDQILIRDSIANANVQKELNTAMTAGDAQFNVNLSKMPRLYLRHEVLSVGKNVTIYDKVFKYTFAFPAPIKPKWTLLNETKEISGYTCAKAQTDYGDRKIIVWYTRDLPIQEGPYTFKGLPGLVIAAEDNSNSYNFKLIYLKKEAREILPQKNAITTTYSKFVSARKESRNNAINDVQSILHREVTPQEKEIVNRNMSRPTNYLD